MRKLTLFSVFVLLIGLVGGVYAAVSDDLNWEVGCDGFTNVGGGLILDRDNTGDGLETFIITGLDGTGKVIFGPLSEDFFTGSSLYLNDGITFEWTATPTANPLYVTVISPAGNGLPEQVVYSTSGRCSGLPDAEEVTDLTGAEIANPEVIIAGQPGYLIVNTFRLNMRSGDGAEYTVVGQVNGGTRLAVLGVNAERTWWYVQANNIRGWVRNDFVIVRGNLTNTPIVVADGVILPPRFFLYIGTDIYSRATTSSSVVCHIPGNREYVIVGRNANATWYGIEAECDGETVVAWIDAELGAVRNPGNQAIPILP
ncbi:MAG: hypothetical protein D6711_16020 [Chloroflexi bacterium]|nr:MAG: hypothetical protein D6711_16020 [Chloroflexota bacterium]